MSEAKHKPEVVMNGLNINEPFDHILKVRAIMERVNSRLKPSGAAGGDGGTFDASRLREAAPKIDLDLCFKAEPDGILEVAFTAPCFVPSWAMPDTHKVSGLDMDGYSIFRRKEEPLQAAALPLTCLGDASAPAEESATEGAVAAETPPPVTGKPKNDRQAVERSVSRMSESVIEPERTAARAASGRRPSFRPGLGRKAAFAALGAAAMIALVLSLALEPGLGGGINPLKSASMTLNIDEDAPLVDLYIDQAEPLESPVIEEPELQTAAVEPEEPAPEFITSEELLAKQAAPAPVKDAEAERYALDLELALLPEAPPATPVEAAKPTLLAQVGASVKTIIASPTLATISEELGIAPSAGDGEEKETAPPEPLYTLEAFPDRLPVGRAADVVFTLKKSGQPLAARGFDVRFENNPAFPNLRDIARYPDEHGNFTVKGLKPGKAGVAALRLYIDDISVDAPLYIAAPGMAAPVKPIKAAAALPAAPSAPALESEDIAAPLPPPAEWRINPGLLRGQLELWSARAGYQLVWEAKNDFEMFSQASFQDDYIGAVRNLFTAMHEQGNPLKVTVYQGNRVLKVTEE